MAITSDINPIPGGLNFNPYDPASQINDFQTCLPDVKVKMITNIHFQLHTRLVHKRKI